MTQSKSNELVLNRKLHYRLFKRGLDIVASLIGLIVLIPLWLIVSLLIVLEDPGCPIYIQKRSGCNGTPFKMFKFRSMISNADKMQKEMEKLNENDGPAFKMHNDPRVTRVGAFIRRTSIDELPQLLNVLLGNMSLVGPRPLPVYETERCNAYQKQRLLVKPGITCYWQVSGRSDVSFNEWIEMDLRYIREASVLTDIKLLLLTVKAVLTGKGAY